MTGTWADKRVAVALDATNLGTRFHVPTAAVVYRGCAGPVAWAVLRGNTPDAWNPHWARSWTGSPGPSGRAGRWPS